PTTVTDTTARQSGDLTANLAKLSYRNTAGDVLQLRDDATAVFQAPSLTIDKSLVPGASSRVRGGDVVPYRVTVANPSAVSVADVAVTDVLPAGIAPADVTNPGTATVSTNGAGRTVLTWPLFALAAGGTTAFDYAVTLPSTFAPNAALTNVATIDRYVVVSNQGTQTTYAPRTTSDETVRIVAPTVVKSQTTSISESGNSADGQATIGETVSYVIVATIPAGTTLPAGTLRDVVPTGLQITGTPTATLNGGAVPQGWEPTVSGQTVTVTRGAAYLNAAGSGDDLLEVRISAVVTNVAGNAHGVRRDNSAQLLWNGGTTVSSNTTRVTIVEPQVRIAKIVEGGAQNVRPGQSIVYV
ncbi:isopeptide-forming domain-containing fimbrial protein, partial [Burkholderia cenocepacia]|uniref:isopeptide-forming domain-containing fimbrial protein n=1 Tax=Burkholderia cenocepacia TaxID=95486 RepID=UPI0038CC1A40